MPADKRNLARHYRNNMTKPEVLLWLRLKDDRLGIRFRRQFQFDGFLLDFYCPSLKLNVEVDGKIHALRERSDAERDAVLAGKGVQILRFSARSVFADLDAVVARIIEEIERLKGEQS